MNSGSRDLAAWGWDEDWAAAYGADLATAAGKPARVVGQERSRWTVITLSGPTEARIPARDALDTRPVTGDWVAVAPGPEPADPLSILRVLPRRTAFRRGSAGDGTHEQVLAANVDHVWIAQGLDTPINARRIERYLAMAWESGARPLVLLTKHDLAHDPAAARDEASRVAIGVDVECTSERDPESIERLASRLGRGRTVVILGPSGAGKSTLVNRLAGAEVAASADVRAGDRKGRHTTTRRELFRVQGGGLVIDTPGLRELRVWDLDEGLERAYPEINALSDRCRFRDCRHETEPGCAVLAAAESGELPEDRLAGYRKLQAEAAHARRQSDHRARLAAVAEHKTALKTLRYHPKRRDRG